MSPADSQQPSDDSARVLADALRERIGDDKFESRFTSLVAISSDATQLTVAVGTPYLLNYLRRTYAVPVAEVAAAHGRETNWVLDAALAVETAVSGEQAPPVAAPVLKPSRESLPSRFDDFEVSDSNRTAWSIARGFAIDPLDMTSGGTTERIAYVYGDHGLGKTHLLEAIRREIKRQHRDLQVMSMTAWEFGNALGDAIQNRTTPMFRARFRSVDVLLLDNVCFFDGHRKESFQEGLLQTIDKLQSDGKAVFLTGSLHPGMLTKTSADLVSRLQGGSVARLAEPDDDLRLRVATRFAKSLGLTITPDALKYVATKFRRSMRELQGPLRTIANEVRAEEELARLSQPEVAGELFDIARKPTRRVGITLARKILGSIERESTVVVRIGDIERQVCELFGVDRGDLRSTSKTRRLSRPRMVAMYLARRMTPAAYKEIGEHFGGRNHSTVISAERTIKKLVSEGATVRAAASDWAAGELIAELEHRLRAG